MIPIEVGTRVWKKLFVAVKCKCGCGELTYVEGVAELEVTEPGFIADYERTTLPGGGVNVLRKGRVRAAKVLRIFALRDLSEHTIGHSAYAVNFRYVVNGIVRPKIPFDETNVACASGIHCFLTRNEAERYII